MAEENATLAVEVGLSRFCTELLNVSQFTYNREFLTGSRVEIPRNKGSMGRFGIDLTTSDVDRMEYSVERYAFPREQPVPEEYNGDVLRILSHNDRPGYVSLIREKTGKEFLHMTFGGHRPPKEDMNGPALKHKFEFNRNLKNKNCSPEKLNLNNCVSIIDRVCAVHSPYWPVEVSEWITRTRRHACPSTYIIKKVVRYGCDFVGIAHKMDRDRGKENEWRFSFSKAELFIIRSWTSSQRIVYRALRLIHKIMVKSSQENKETVLCTYYYKTLMLWACEEQPPEFWTDSSLVVTVRHLLIKMCECLISQHCPNYFIPGNNMMDHLTPNDALNAYIDMLLDYSEITPKKSDFLQEVIECCKEDEDLCARTKYQIKFPMWMHAAMLVLKRIKNPTDSYTDLFLSSYSSDLKKPLDEMFKGIYKALRCHQEAVSCTFGNGVANEFSKNLSSKEAVSLFQAASCVETRQKRFNIDPECNDTLNAYLWRHDSNQTVLQVFGISDCLSFASFCFIICFHHLLETSSGFIQEDVSKCHGLRAHENMGTEAENESLTNEAVGQTELAGTRVPDNANTVLGYIFRSMPCLQNDAEWSPTDSIVYNHVPLVGPTVHVSWFIVKAYLANLHYTARLDRKATVETCDDIINTSMKTLANKLIAHWIFPVLITTQFSTVYDKEVQAMLGFYSLCRFCSNRTRQREVRAGQSRRPAEVASVPARHNPHEGVARRRSVQLGVCSIRFALYLKLRCALDDKSWSDFKNGLEQFNIHYDKCRLVTDRCSGDERAANTFIEPISCTSAAELRSNAANYAVRLVAQMCTNAQRDYAY